MALSNDTPWVDVDDPSTWPPTLGAHVEKLADHLRDTTEYTTDLKIPQEDEDHFRKMLLAWPVRAYHATRLLDHEVQMIRVQGLRPLSAELIEERIDAAWQHSCISLEERDRLLRSHVFATAEHEHRAEQCCLFLPQRLLFERPSGINPLLGSWGGEAISMSNARDELPERLFRLGRPAIVVAHVDLSEGQAIHPVFPGMQKLFTGRLLNLKDVGADVFYRAPIPSDHISAIWQPGSGEYDQFEDLRAC